MEITTTPPNKPLQLKLTLPVRELGNMPFRTGQEVTAVVQSPPDNGKVMLNINGRLLQAVTTLQLTQGMNLKMTVEQENQQIVLRLQPEQQQRLVQQQALRQLLPRQDSLKPLLESLVKMLPKTVETASVKVALDTAATPPAPAPTVKTAAPETKAIEQVQKLALQILSQSASPQSVGDAKGLKQAISHSGLFLEYSLAASSAGAFSGDRDLKVLLLRLAALIRQTLAGTPVAQAGGKTPADPAQAIRQASIDALLQLQKQAEAGLARIQVNQLASSGTSPQGEERPLLLELPLFNPAQNQTELLKLRVQREKPRSGDQGEECWSVTLQLSPAEYGEINAIVSLTGGKVSVTFWCAEAGTRELFREQLEVLTERLQEQGLEVGRCNAHQGTPVSAEPEIAKELLTLIDIQA